MICMDNSEWMRNGDYPRTRFEAQYQAIEHILRVKTSNLENTVGLLSLAGGLNVGVQVLCSPTTERYKVGRAASSAKIGGKADLATGLRVAQLALKYRAERKVQARIVVFIGSPIDQDETTLLKIGKQLKKSNIAVDIISMGELEANEAILTKFMAEVDKKDPNAPCTLVIVPPGVYPEDAIRDSSIGNVQEEMDPMLAAAMRESLEMAQREQAAAAMQGSSNAADQGEFYEDDDAMLEQAKLMSMMAESENEATKSGSKGDASSLLNENYLEKMIQEAGANPDDPDVKKELEELKKAQNSKKKRDADGKKK